MFGGVNYCIFITEPKWIITNALHYQQTLVWLNASFVGTLEPYLLNIRFLFVRAFLNHFVSQTWHFLFLGGFWRQGAGYCPVDFLKI